MNAPPEYISPRILQYKMERLPQKTKTISLKELKDSQFVRKPSFST